MSTQYAIRLVPLFVLILLAACGSSSTPDNFSVGGMVSGLAGSGLVLENNGGGDLPINASGAFKFSATLATNVAYSVTIKSQPTGPSQTCSVTGSSGLVGNASVTSVAVVCATNTYTVSGSATGLSGSGLVLTDNGSDDLPVAANGSFAFKSPVASGGAYDVAVKTQPSAPSQTCAVTGANGTISNAPVSSVVVSCQVSAARFVYVSNVTDGSISAFSVDGVTGSLTPIVGSPFITGSSVWSLFSASSRFLYVNGESSSNITGFAIDATTGALSQIAGSPFASGLHPGSGVVSPSGKFAYVTHNGPSGIDIYSIDPTSGALSPTTGSPFVMGSALTSIALTPSGNFAYIADTGAPNVAAYSVDTTSGALTQAAGSPYVLAQPTSADALVLDEAGQFVYVLNSTFGDIWGFAADLSAALTSIPGSPFVIPPQGVPPFGSAPNDLAIHPSGKFAYALSYTLNGILEYTRDANSGALALISATPVPTGSQPHSMALEASGKYLYVVNEGSNNLSGYSIEAATGRLTPIPGSPFAVGPGPIFVKTIQ